MAAPAENEKHKMSKVLTVAEVAGYLHVHPSTIYRLTKRGVLPCFKVGSDWRFNLESIDRWRIAAESDGAFVTTASANLRHRATEPSQTTRKPQKEMPTM